MAELTLGVAASSLMTDCETYGMNSGCDTECPVLIAGDCEFMHDENKELYEEATQ